MFRNEAFIGNYLVCDGHTEFIYVFNNADTHILIASFLLQISFELLTRSLFSLMMFWSVVRVVNLAIPQVVCYNGCSAIDASLLH